MNRINPKKLFRSKWTAVSPVKKEKHFMVTEVEFDEGEVVRCMIEAVITKREEDINWRELTDNQNWLPGWK
ncbi:TIGR02450 family Trp-rich protein [Vibrio crassostreae]|uniref:TIGR02450 family Trp-rich protein n=1 Tax=Vibrio crassostreae TaxID=246167 RepID=UPI000F49248D|nr:TIGR02450 family Trp-rich protein [Vibrio crassostreae]